MLLSFMLLISTSFAASVSTYDVSFLPSPDKGSSTLEIVWHDCATSFSIKNDKLPAILASDKLLHELVVIAMKNADSGCKK